MDSLCIHEAREVVCVRELAQQQGSRSENREGDEGALDSHHEDPSFWEVEGSLSESCQLEEHHNFADGVED